MLRSVGQKPGGRPKGLPHYIIATVVAGACSLHAADGKQTILGSKHNFAVGSTAEVRSSTEQRVCTFCHSPHLPKPAPVLWSHAESAVAEYGPYSSTTLGSQVGQPGTADSSKLCLSCHDGTVALDSDGPVYVVEGLHDVVQILDTRGNLLLAFGRTGAADGEFYLPTSIHIDRDDNIYVADSYNRRIQVFRYLKDASARRE